MSSFYTLRKPQRPVTILLGFATANEIVLASDSLISFFPSTGKQPEVEKITKVKLSASQNAILAKAGNWRTTNDIQRFIESPECKIEIINSGSAATVAETAVKKARAHLLDTYSHPSLEQEARQQHIRDYDSDVIFAYYYESKPFIFTSSISDARMILSSHSFVAVGCAEHIARSLLTGFEFRRLNRIHAIGLAAFVVERCIAADCGCEGPLQVGILTKDGRCVIVPRKKVAAFSTTAQIVASDMRIQLLKNIRTTFATIKDVFTGDITFL